VNIPRARQMAQRGRLSRSGAHDRIKNRFDAQLSSRANPAQEGESGWIPGRGPHTLTSSREIEPLLNRDHSDVIDLGYGRRERAPRGAERPRGPEPGGAARGGTSTPGDRRRRPPPEPPHGQRAGCPRRAGNSRGAGSQPEARGAVRLPRVTGSSPPSLLSLRTSFHGQRRLWA